MRNICYVDPPCHDIGCHQNFMNAVLEILEGFFPLPLASIRVDSRNGYFRTLEEIGKLIGSRFGPGEDENGLGIRLLQNLENRSRLIHAAKWIDAMKNSVGRRRGRRDGNVHGRGERLARQARNGGWNSCREKHRLPLLGEALEDICDFLREPHVEHAVSFVQN